jgi:hypothetical protein
MLTRTNYQEWTMLMHVNLDATGCKWCYTVEPEKSEVIVYCHDRLAFVGLLRFVSPDMLVGLYKRRMTTKTWESIKQICIEV